MYKKIIIISFLLFNLSGCTIFGITLIEKAETEESKEVVEEENKTMSFLGYNFSLFKDEKTRYSRGNVEARSDNQNIVLDFNQEIYLIGYDSSMTLSLIKIEGDNEYYVVDSADLAKDKYDANSDVVVEIPDEFEGDEVVVVPDIDDNGDLPSSESPKEEPEVKEEKPAPTPKPEKEEKPAPTPKPEKEEKPVSTPKPEKEVVKVPKPKPSGGISYPGGNDTSFNVGIKFANVNYTAKIVWDTEANSGPGKAVPSTGFTVLRKYNVGENVKVTGVGENGWIRIKMSDGRVAFIYNTHMSKK